MYNHIDETLKCLISVALAGDSTSFELIIADDCSSDNTQSLFQDNPAIRYYRNDKNRGFLQTCNQAAKIAHGKFLFLLNNDVLVTPNWLDSIQETFKNNPDAGLIGSKLYNLNLSLQEAGGVIWWDATGWNYGRNDDPKRPQYNYLREVDYCSGASIAIPKTLWDQLGGFDERFSPAYYEDVDLAFQIRESGYRVLFQPFSRVFHAEGKTSGTDISSGVKRFQDINRLKFRKKWEHVLETHGQYDSAREILFRNRYRKLHALVIDSITPTPDMDCGSIMLKHYIQMLYEFGFDICFIPEENFLYYGRYTTDLETSGIECLYNPYHSSVKNYLQKNGNNLDLVLISRAPVAIKYIDDIKKYAPSARIIFNTVDLHFLREERKASLQLLQLSKAQLLKSRTEEISIMRKADQTILVSEYEKNVIKIIDQDVKTTVIPIPSEIPGRTYGFGQRKDILFLSGFQHDPNVDAVLYFVKNIWHLISSRLPGVNFLIAGSNMPDEISGIQGENIKILGYIPNLDDVYSTCKLSVAPLRYGAGVKGKVVTSLGFGVPCVCTGIAAEGMNLAHQETILIADTPEDFAESIFQIYTNQALWEKLSDNGLVFVSERFSTRIVKEKLRNLLIETGIKL